MIVYEFFSGIGGMHEAFKGLNDISIKKIFPFDINPNANQTYLLNYDIEPYQMSIESFTLEDYESQCKKEEVNEDNLIWTMSPPCQPFTRQGLEKDLEDNRTNAFKHLLTIFTKTQYKPTYLLLENVKNFEDSKACKLIIEKLKESHYSYKQFLLSPIQFNIPNSRLRYYLLARSSTQKEFIQEQPQENVIINEEEAEKSNGEIIKDVALFKEDIEEDKNIREFLKYNPLKEKDKKQLYLTKKLLEKESTKVIDIALLNNKSSNCFTKNYTRLLKGTGSILLLKAELYKQCLDLKTVEGYLRYFTPQEILQFLCFKDDFCLPQNLTSKTQYRLLGNSVNVKVIHVLLKYLFKQQP